MIVSGILPGILSGIYSDILSDIYTLAFYLPYSGSLFWQTFWNTFRSSVWQLKSSGAQCDPELAKRIGEEGKKKEEEEEGDGFLIKSRNPYLAIGEKRLMLFLL